MKSLAERARDFARIRHASQTDKAGNPYFGHLQRVADRVESDEAKALAYLHDVVEDGHATSGEIEGLFPELAGSVNTITKRAGDDYGDYLQLVGQDLLALEVKLADIADNSDEARLAKLPREKAEELRRKYANALDRLRKLRS